MNLDSIFVVLDSPFYMIVSIRRTKILPGRSNDSHSFELEQNHVFGCISLVCLCKCYSKISQYCAFPVFVFFVFRIPYLFIQILCK